MVLERTVQVGLITGYRLVLAVTRLCVGPLVVLIAREQQLDTETKSVVLSAFAAGYLCTQILGGYLSTVFGGKPIVVAALLLSAVCTLSLAPAATVGVGALWTAQAMMGLAQGPSFPTSSVLCGRWVPRAERGWAAALGESGGAAGAFIAVGGTTLLGERLGWRNASGAIGIFALIFTCVYIVRATSSPQDAAHRLSAAEAELLRRECPAPRGAPSVSPAEFLRAFARRSVVAILSAHFAFNFGRYLLVAWSPSYFDSVLRADPATASACLVTSEVVSAAASVISGILGDAAQRRGLVSTLGCRRLFSGVGFVFATGALLGLALGPIEVGFTTAMLCMFSIAHSLHASGYKSSYLDVGGARYGGTLSGLGNTWASIGSYLGPRLVGAALLGKESEAHLLQQAWRAIYSVAAVVTLVGGALYVAMVDDRRIEDVSKDATKKES